MTRTVRRFHAIVRAAIGEILAAVGTFVVLLWTGVHLVRTLEASVGVALTPAVVPELWRWVVLLALAAVLTIWLERRGYRRLGADPAGGWTAAVLAVVSLPLSVLPIGIALSALGVLSASVLPPFLLACVAVAGWLALYGGLERLGLESGQFLFAAALACVPPVAIVVTDALVDLGSVAAALAEPTLLTAATVVLAIGWQVVVIVFSFVRPVSIDRRRPTMAAFEPGSSDDRSG